jgi:hypothetical protein
VTPYEEVTIGLDVGEEGICFETENLPLLVSRSENSVCHNATDKLSNENAN